MNKSTFLVIEETFPSGRYLFIYDIILIFCLHVMRLHLKVTVAFRVGFHDNPSAESGNTIYFVFMEFFFYLGFIHNWMLV